MTRCPECGTPLDEVPLDKCVTHEKQRPPEPGPRSVEWYRGWECGYDSDAAFWTKHGWRAYKGGVDIDVPTVDGATWPELLDEIDAEEDEA